jgi:hypothetical protein
MGRRKHDIPACSPESLRTAARRDLSIWFEAEFGRTPAPRSSLEFLRQNLAWAFQARSVGKDSQRTRQKLIRQLNLSLAGSKQHQHLHRAGTRLVREWQGKVYEVTVLDEGYAWEGRVYPNLTRIATEITGTKWSGPRFFGLVGSKRRAE